MARGFLVSFEALERAGKSTQIQMLADWLAKQSVSYEVGREPGDTAYGEAARRFVQDPHFIERLNQGYESIPSISPLQKHNDLNSTGELFGYLIARSMFVQHKIKPAILKDHVFIADRCADSSVAYQGYGNWLGDPRKVTFVQQCNDFIFDNLHITRTYYLDLSYEDSLSRKGDAEFGVDLDRIEQRKKEYFERVRSGYLQLAQDDPKRIMTIDAMQSIQKVHQTIVADMRSLLELHGHSIAASK